MKFSSLEEGNQRFALQFFIILLESDYTSVTTGSKLGTHTDRCENELPKWPIFFQTGEKKSDKQNDLQHKG